MKDRIRPVRDLWGGLGAAFETPRVRILLTMTAILIFFASVVYHWAEGWRWIDAVYFSVVTISTVGYGDLAPRTDVGKIFTIVYVLCGLGLFVSTATAIADSIISRTSDEAEKERGRE